MLRCYLMDPDTDVCQTEQPQISYSVDFTAEQSSAMGSPILLDRESGGYHLSSIMDHRSQKHSLFQAALFLDAPP